MMNELVSVIIPTYNRAIVIGRALDSVFSQLYEPLQVIVVDDGSTDHTLEELQKYDGRIELVRQKNQGVAAARNKGLSIARGKYIAFLDSDDEWLPGKLRNQLKCFEDVRIGVVAGAMVDVLPGGRVRISRQREFHGEVTTSLLKYNFVSTSTVLLRRSLILEHSLHFESVFSPSEDWQFWLKLSALTRFHVSKEIVGRRYLGDDNISSRANQNNQLAATYKAIYQSLLNDDKVGTIFFRHKALMRSSFHVNMACYYAQVGRTFQAKGQILSAILAAPLTLKWDSALKILLLKW